MKTKLFAALLSVSVIGLASAESLPPPPVVHTSFYLQNKSDINVGYAWKQLACGSQRGAVAADGQAFIDCSNADTPLYFMIGSSSDPSGECRGHASGAEVYIDQPGDGSQKWVCAAEDGNVVLHPS